MSSFLILEEKKYYLSNIGIYIYCHSCFRKEGTLHILYKKGNINCAYLLNLLSKPAKQKIRYFNLSTLIVS